MSARSASTAWDIACDAADPPTPAPLSAPLNFPAPATRHDCPSESPPPTAPSPTGGPDGPAAPALEGRGGAVPPPFRPTGSSGGRRTLSGPVGSVSEATARAGRFPSGGSSGGGGGAEDGCGGCSVGGSFLRRAEVIWAGSGVRRAAGRGAAAHGLRACAHCLHALPPRTAHDSTRLCAGPVLHHPQGAPGNSCRRCSHCAPWQQAPSFLSRGADASRRPSGQPGQRALRREFVAEMRLLARLRHPCVTTVRDLGGGGGGGWRSAEGEGENRRKQQATLTSSNKEAG
jgi:hypothetical protein